MGLSYKEEEFSIIWWIIIFIIVWLIASWLFSLYIILENNNPHKTAAWIAGLFAFPLLGMVLYLVIGRHPFKRRKVQAMSARGRIQHSLENYDDLIENSSLRDYPQKLIHLLLDTAEIPLTVNNSTQILTNGHEKFHSLLKALETATDHIHMEYYIFRNDMIGTDVSEILMRKASEGVQVRIILDGLGSRKLPRKLVDQWRKKGIEAAFFFPVHFPYLSSRLNYRNHRKIVIVDGKVGFLGGINIGDEYLSRSIKYGFWRDTHMKIVGQAVHYLQTIFLNDWFFVTGQRLEGECFFPYIPPIGNQALQIVASGPDSNRKSVTQLFFSVLSNAEECVYIVTPYFIPDESLTMALKTAARSGLDVRIIVQGKPEHKFTYWAGRSYYESMLDAGVKIYEYQKGILHSKVLLIDHRLGIIGSANFDIRSFQLNFEVSAICYNKDIVARLEYDFWRDVDDSTEVLAEEYLKRSSSEKVKESLARLLSPLL